MDDTSLPVDVTLEVEDAENISTLFIGYETTDGTEVIVASAAPPARAELQGSRLQTDDDS